MRRIGLLGGSFNPAHAGHLHISLEAMKRLGLDEIWWLVSPQNPLKSSAELGDYALRLAHAHSLAKHPRIHVLDLEARHGLRYSIDTLRFLQAHHPRTQFVWLMGADNLTNFHRWRDWRAIAARVPIAVLDRAPYGLKALHGKFALSHRRARLLQRNMAGVAMQAVGWMYLSIPRHPLSATFLRKTLGAKAFLGHN
ncbi:MAG: nicotinate (nicotinamide) nucleotide adenylyltransferase [Rickettsiales bacterium]